jgi:hypothetical protein
MTNCPKTLRCPICHSKADFQLYSEGVYVAGCAGKKHCYSLPFCGACSKEEAAKEWNKWVCWMRQHYPFRKNKTVIITCRKCEKPARFSKNEEICDSCGYVYDLFALKETEENGKI